MIEDKALEVQLSQVRAFDYSSVARETEGEAGIMAATTAFGMGWTARSNGLSLRQRPQFADDTLITDWISGWEAKDRKVRGST